MFYGYGTWLIFALPAMLLALFAQWRVQAAYRKYSAVPNAQGLSGEQVAAILMRNEGLNIGVEHIAGDLTDHYDPRAKVMRLSQGSVKPSVAAMAIVAHELGHAAQDKQNYVWLRARSGIVGVANVGSQLGSLLFFGGLLMSTFMRNGFGIQLAWIGVILFAGAVAFTLVTLPVEFNASSRARDMLARNGLVTAQEADGVRAMLNAAALTYVAAAAQAVSQLLYFITLLSGANRRN